MIRSMIKMSEFLLQPKQVLQISIVIGLIAFGGTSCKEATHTYDYGTYERLDTPVPGPDVSLTVSSPNIDENVASTTRSSVVTATLSERASAATTVTFDFVGSATNGADYSLNRTAITIPAGQLSESITVSAIDDSINDDGETVVVDMKAVSGGDNAQEIGTQQETITITDDEGSPSVTLAKDLDNVTEGNDLTLTVRLSRVATTNTTVVLNPISGTAPVASQGAGFDYFFLTSSTVTIAAGQLSDNVTVRTRNDSIDDNAETITIEISSVTGGDGALESGNQQVSATISDNTSPSGGITLSTSSSSISEDGGVAVITASMNPDANGNGPVQATTVTLDWPPTGGTAIHDNSTDYILTNTVITIPAGGLSSSTTLKGVNDEIDNASNPTVLLSISSVSGGDGVGIGTPSQQTITLQDDDSAGFTITESNGTLVSETGTSDTFTVVLDTMPGADVTLSVTDNDTSEVSYSPSSLVFGSGNWSVAQIVTVTGVQTSPPVRDGTQYTTITVTPSSTDSSYNTPTLGNQTIVVATTDNETGGFAISKTTANVSENGTSDYFTVVLNNDPLNPAPGSNVVFVMNAGTPTEAVVAPSTLTFSSGNWAIPQTVTVTGVDDSLTDGDQASTITVSLDRSATDTLDSEYDNVSYSIPDQTVTVTTQDNDGASFTLNNGGGISVSEDNTVTDSFTIVLDSPPTANVVLDITSDDSTETSVATSRVTFTPSNWNVPQTIAVSGVNDNIADGDVSSTITVSVNQARTRDNSFDPLPDQTVSVITTDDDAAGFTLNKTTLVNLPEQSPPASDIFTVVLDSQPTGNVMFNLSVSHTGHTVVLNPASLLFTPQTWNNPQNITVIAPNDAITEGDQTYNVIVSVNTGSTQDPSFLSLPSQLVGVTVIDND